MRILNVRQSETLSPVEAKGLDSPMQGVAADGLAPVLPQGDRIEAQRAVCEAIAQLVRVGKPEISQLGELFALERHAQPLTRLLLSQYVEGDGQLRSLDWKAWRSAMQLSQAFFQAHEYLLHHVRNSSDDTWTRHEPSILIQLFHHRKVEFLLRFIRYKKRNSGQWRQLHELYRSALEREMRDRTNVAGETQGQRRTTSKLEQQYLQILLLEVMNTGQFSPREALWAHRWFARWCGGPALQLTKVNGGIECGMQGFVVDLEGSDGLKRASSAAGNLLYLDSSPLAVLIGHEIAALTDSAVLQIRATPAERAGQLALLNKLAILFSPDPIDIERRAERKPVAHTVQAIAGFPFIVAELRRNAQKRNHSASSTATSGSENTISPFGGSTFLPTFTAGGTADQANFSVTDQMNAIPQIWQVKDRSDTGCRMRGQIDNMNRVIPGSLIAIRDSDTTPWTVSVVRWFRRLMVDHVEIGIEYLGSKPRLIKLVADHDRDVAVDTLPDSASKCFAALYLPPSEQRPTIPIKTLLLPAREFRAGFEVTLLSSSATYRMRLNEPIQNQFEFVLTSFSVIDKSAPVRPGIQ
jgi:hypothetical protein